MQKYEVTGTFRGIVERTLTRDFMAENEDDAAEQFSDLLLNLDRDVRPSEVYWDDADIESIHRA